MKRFNIRVYGIIINENDQVLVADENRYGRAFTKFPGGGLEWGEGTKECLERELLEELGVKAQIEEPFYITDFFQQSAFNENDQLMSFYYRVDIDDYYLIKTGNHQVPLVEDGEEFRWINLNDLSENDFTFSIDKRVAKKLNKLFRDT